MDKTSEFLLKAKVIHGTKYDYSKTIYTRHNIKVKIVCKVHGLFEQTPNNHLNGQGCPKCGRERQIKKASYSNDEFLKKAKLIHGDKYEYLSIYKNQKSIISVTCKKHKNTFKVIANKHLYRKQGCPLCTRENLKQKFKSSTDEFIEKAKKIHGDKYDYSETVYNDSETKLKIKCKKHGFFMQLPCNHLHGKGCVKCSIDCKQENNSLSNEEFISRAKEIHCDRYDYSKINYINNHTDIEIICSRHGSFWQSPKVHLKSYGCHSCFLEENCLNTEKFIEYANKIHNNKYDYSLAEYKGYKEKISIICPYHGKFEQSAVQHLRNNGCPVCPTTVSTFHQEIIDYLIDLNIKYDINNRTVLNGVEIDIYIPDFNFAIECHGLYWHSYDHLESKKEIYRHYYKADRCLNKNIFLLQVFDNEWRNKQEIIKSMIKNRVKLSKPVYARNCIVSELNNIDYNNFIENNHIQGSLPASVKLGLFHNDDLMFVLSFRKHHKYNWEVARLSNKIGYRIIGGASKLLAFFIKNFNPENILTYSDRRFGTGKVYEKLGFVSSGVTEPGYYYTDKKNLFRRQIFQKHKLCKKLSNFDFRLSESVNMFNNGYRRIWDAGHCKYIWGKL